MSTRRLFIVLIALLLAAGSFSFEWFIYKPYVDQSTVKLGGYWSDLYPRWYGTRELLLHGRDPYSPEVSREILIGYGFDASADLKSQPGVFAYPLYIVLLLAPFTHFGFPLVVKIFTVMGWLAAAISVPMWARAMKVHLGCAELLLFSLGTLSSFPVLSCVSLQQPSLFVLPLLAAVFVCVLGQRFWLAGILLALGTIKPQLTALPIILVLLWSAFDWRNKRAIVIGFFATLLICWGACELLVRGWVSEWLSAMHVYTSYTGPPLSQMIFGTKGGEIFGLAALVFYFVNATLVARKPVLSDEFFAVLSLGILIELFIMTNGAKSLYNHVLLLPVIMLVWKLRERYQPAAVRLTYGFGTVWLILPWVIATIVAVKAAANGRPLQPTFAPFNIALFLPLVLLLLVIWLIARKHTPAESPVR